MGFPNPVKGHFLMLMKIPFLVSPEQINLGSPVNIRLKKRRGSLPLNNLNHWPSFNNLLKKIGFFNPMAKSGKPSLTGIIILRTIYGNITLRMNYITKLFFNPTIFRWSIS